MVRRLVQGAVAAAVVLASQHSSGLATGVPFRPAADGGAGTFTASGDSYYFDLFNSGTTAWQAFVVVAPPGATFVGGATAGEATARCLPGRPDGLPNEIECGPLSATAAPSYAHLSFVATIAAPPACGAVFELEVTSTGSGPFTRGADLDQAGSCTSGRPKALAPPTVRGKPVVGGTLTATPGRWSSTPSRVGYRWQRCGSSGCSAIPGATRLSLRLTPADAHRKVRVVATAVIAGTRVVSRSAELTVRAGAG